MKIGNSDLVTTKYPLIKVVARNGNSVHFYCPVRVAVNTLMNVRTLMRGYDVRTSYPKFGKGVYITVKV